MLHIKKIWGLVEKTLELVQTSNNLPEWQAVKPTFFCTLNKGRKLKSVAFIQIL